MVIVSDIAGTTRDTIEERMTIKGIQFRFIDTAGLRETSDEIEKDGLLRTMNKMEKSTLYIYLFDVMNSSLEDMKKDLETMKKETPKLTVANKIDRIENSNLRDYESLEERVISNSAKDHVGLNKLMDQL